MPRHSLSDGQVSDIVKNYPALTVQSSRRTLERANLDPSDPNLNMQILGSPEFATEAAHAVTARGDTNAFLGQLDRPLNRPDPNDPIGTQTSDLFQEREDFQRGQIRSTNMFARRMFEASQNASKLADFNQVAFKTTRLKELDPTSDIDDQIMKLRFRQFKEEADIRSNPKFNHLSPAAKQRLIETNRHEARETGDGLRELRNARLGAAEGRIDEEISSRNQIISRAKARVSDLKDAAAMFEKTGNTTEAYFDIIENRLKAEKKLAAAKGNMGDSDWEVMARDIINSMINLGLDPDSGDRKNAEARAKQILRQREEQQGQAETEQGANIPNAGVRSATLASQSRLPAPFDPELEAGRIGKKKLLALSQAQRADKKAREDAESN